MLPGLLVTQNLDTKGSLFFFLCYLFLLFFFPLLNLSLHLRDRFVVSANVS